MYAVAVQFLAENYLLQDQLGICSYLTNTVTVPHFHDYYEIFLVEKGTGTHVTQQGSFEIVPGDLCFVRPEDIHFFKSNKCEMFNILISDELWNQAAAFIGPSPVLRDLTGAETPIKINLHQEDFEFTRHMLETNILVPYNNKDDYNAQLKLVLIAMLKLFFTYPLQEKEQIPPWMDNLLKQMQNPARYAEGIEAMYRISGYTPEHLCRSFKRYLNTTPTAYLNALRIHEASRFLIYTDEEILEIASKCGFNSLSHFYHLFKTAYCMSPMQYRKLRKFQRSAQ